MPTRLTSLTVEYINCEEQLKKERIIVLDVVADNVRNIFKELLKRKFPINSLRDIQEFNYDDDKSMLANNSSAFNPRTIANISCLLYTLMG